ncbi:MAG TPA: hypothetical protein VF624_07440 [Tepidisphaeraceae bacterium]
MTQSATDTSIEPRPLTPRPRLLWACLGVFAAWVGLLAWLYASHGASHGPG